MMVLTYPVSFSSIACIIFFKMADQNFREWQPPYTRTLTGYPTSVLGGTPDFFFAKMTAKDELKGKKNLGSVSFAFLCYRKKSPPPSVDEG